MPEISPHAERSLLADGTIVVTEQVRWKPVAGPEDCECGHAHHGRIADRGRYAGFAPQWGICDSLDCTCSSLRPWAPDGGGGSPL